MKVTFVLVLLFWQNGVSAIRVGGYNRHAQCVQQGELLITRSATTMLPPFAYYCIPVNTP